MKVCTKCHNEYPATTGYFTSDKRNKDKLSSWCKICRRIADKKYQQTKRGKCTRQKYWQSEKGKTVQQEYLNTINGHLRGIYNHIKQRCTNPKNKSYKNYGDRGIELRFTFDRFLDYIKNDLGYDTYEKIKKLWIDRINNNGHYEKGNIRFVTAKVSANNRRKK